MINQSTASSSTLPPVDTHAAEVARGQRFEFGRNWARFLSVLDESRIQTAVHALQSMLQTDRLDGCAFLDIGSGSGLSSLAARRLGARVQFGAEVIELPLITISKAIDKHTLHDVLSELGGYDWIVFTSANGVRYFFEEFHRIYDDIRSLGLLRFAAVGETTARAITDQHIKVECMPKVATADALADELTATGSLDSAKVLVITGNLNRDELVRRLEGARAIVDRRCHPAAGCADPAWRGVVACVEDTASRATLVHCQTPVRALGPQRAASERLMDELLVECAMAELDDELGAVRTTPGHQG